MDWTTVVSTVLTALGDVGPIVYFNILVLGALGYVWLMDRREAAQAAREAAARYDALLTSTNTAIAAAQAQVAATLKDHSDANKDTSEVLSTVGRTMNELATTVKDMIAKNAETQGERRRV